MHPIKSAKVARPDLTDDEIARRCREAGLATTTASYINQIANGHRYPSRKFAAVLAPILGCNAGDLLTWMEPAAPSDAAASPTPDAA